MGQKANPIGNRLGIIRGWDSNWYADKDYGLKVVEDEKIRNYLRVRRPKTAVADPRDRNKPMQNGISRIVIERTLKRVTVTIQTSRPGIIIGKGGKEVDLIKEELKVLDRKGCPDQHLRNSQTGTGCQHCRRTDCQANRSPYQLPPCRQRRHSGNHACRSRRYKVRVSGRLGGAEIARTEEYKEGPHAPAYLPRRYRLRAW
jgi:small subunit ribosomal protein S3